MAICEVLRCSNEASATVSLSAPDGPLLEAAVCAEHRRQIDDGAPYRWEQDLGQLTRGSILMGADLDFRDITITRWLRSEEHGLTLHPDGTTAITLVAERLMGDGSTETVRLVVSEQVLLQLKRNPMLPFE